MDFPGPFCGIEGPDVINTFSSLGLGPGVAPTTISAGGWPSANRAYFTPFRVPCPMTVYKMGCATGTGTTGNFDLGIYDAFGNQIVSTGSTAKTTASSERIVDVTDTLLLPGLYYLAMATDGVTNYFALGCNLAHAKLAGIRSMESAFALPATATFATAASGWIPFLSALMRSE